MTLFDLDKYNQKSIVKRRDMLRPISGTNCWYCLYRSDTFCCKFKATLEINRDQLTYYRLDCCYNDTRNRVF